MTNQSTTRTGIFALTGTNATFNIVLVAIYILGAIFGITEADIDAVYFAILPMVGVIREIIEGTRKPRWAGNIVVYLVAALSFFLPSLTDIWEALPPIINAIAEGASIGELWPFLIPLINIIFGRFIGSGNRTPAQRRLTYMVGPRGTKAEYYANQAKAA